MLLVKYHYDGLNRLIREDNYTIKDLEDDDDFGKAYTWTYDVGGNITRKKTYLLTENNDLGAEASTQTYIYGNDWKD